MTVKLVFDNTHHWVNNTFFCVAGTTITGKVKCNFNQNEKIKAIRVKFQGGAHTQWDETKSEYCNREEKYVDKIVTYTGDEYYFNSKINLIQAGNTIAVPPGTHTYQFSYTVPKSIPSSFEGTHGNVRYSIKATVVRSWGFDYTDKVTLHIIAPLDLNDLATVKAPVALSVDKSMCSCWCNDSGALTFNMSMPVTGFVSGQKVDIGCHVQNLTNVNAESIKFKINKYVKFVTRRPSLSTKWETYTIAECTEGGIGAHSEKSWTTTLTIPKSGNYPNMSFCDIIYITYQLKAKVIVAGMHSNLDMEKVHLRIGTIPLRGVNTTFSGAPPPAPEGILSRPDPSAPTAKVEMVGTHSHVDTGKILHTFPRAPPQEEIVSCPGPSAPTAKVEMASTDSILDIIKIPSRSNASAPSEEVPSAPPEELPSHSKGAEMAKLQLTLSEAPPTYNEVEQLKAKATTKL